MTIVSRVAQELHRARVSGTPIPRIIGGLLTSIDDAYEVQREIISQSNLTPAGWKVGATSNDVQFLFGTDEPITARMFDKYCFKSGSSVPIFESFHPQIESEFAFRMGQDLPSRDETYKRDEILDAVRSLIPALEIVACRYEGGFEAQGVIALTSDMSANSEWIAGSEYGDWRETNLKEHRICLFKNGIGVANGTGRNVLGDPLTVLEWAVNHLSRLGDGVKSGEIISTGTCTGLVPAAVGDSFKADFGDLGIVEVHCAEKE